MGGNISHGMTDWLRSRTTHSNLLRHLYIYYVPMVPVDVRITYSKETLTKSIHVDACIFSVHF